jgi:hypothetical protein
VSARGPADRAAQRALLERFAREHPASVLHDAASSTLVDVASGKALPLDWTRVAAVDERHDRQTGRPYLALRRDDGVEVALAEAGIVFAPVTSATGPLDGAPGAVTFRDLLAAEGRLSHALHDHPEEPPDRGHVALLLFCLALVDGARAAGFDVSAEERRLERLLGELEARRRA